MCRKFFIICFAVKEKNNIGAIVGGDYWVRGCFIYYFLRLNDNSTFLHKGNDPAGRKGWSSEERRDN